MFNSAITAGLLRHALTAIGGALVAKGYIGAENIEAVIGAVVTLTGAFLSARSKKA
jgi:hypothetical protein